MRAVFLGKKRVIHECLRKKPSSSERSAASSNTMERYKSEITIAIGARNRQPRKTDTMPVAEPKEKITMRTMSLLVSFFIFNVHSHGHECRRTYNWLLNGSGLADEGRLVDLRSFSCVSRPFASYLCSREQRRQIASLDFANRAFGYCGDDSDHLGYFEIRQTSAASLCTPGSQLPARRGEIRLSLSREPTEPVSHRI